MFWNAVPSAFDGVLGATGAEAIQARSLSSSILSISSLSDIAQTASQSSFQVVDFQLMIFEIALGKFFCTPATRRLLVSGMLLANLSTLSAHTTCASSSSAPTLAAIRFPRLLGFKMAMSSDACFSANVFSVISLAGHQTSKAVLALANVVFWTVVRVVHHMAVGDFTFSESSRSLTLSVSERLVFMIIRHLRQFMKSCGSPSSGLPVNWRALRSAMVKSSETGAVGVVDCVTGSGVAGGLLSCGVAGQVAGCNKKL